MAIEAGAGDVLRKDDADRNEDGPAAGSEGDGNFEARTFGIFIAAAKRDSALREVFADGDFFLKPAAANAGKNASFDAGAIAARNDALVEGLARSEQRLRRKIGLNLDPDRGRFAVLAKARDAFADFEGFQLEFVEINDFSALAKTAFH